MSGRGLQERAPERLITYCVVPRALAPRLHELLRRHFAPEHHIEVVVEQRSSERRKAGEQRRSDRPVATERRQVPAADGRRVADRRAVLLPVDPPSALPRRARPFLDRLAFFERLEPSTQYLEDLDAAKQVMRFQRGDKDAFRDLYMRYFDRVYKYMLAVLTTPEVAEDATQQAFFQVFKALPRYEHRAAPFRAWLFVIVRNCAITQLRKSARIELTDPITLDERYDRTVLDDDEVRVLDWISDRDLLLFIERLPLPQRQVLLLRYTLDMPYSEIAEILGRTTSDVRMLHHRALAFLRRRLAALQRRGEQGTPHGLVRVRPQAVLLRRRRFALIR